MCAQYPLPADLEADLDFLRQILEALPLAVFLVDTELRIHRLNEAAVKSLGLDRGTILLERAGEALRCLNAADAPHGCGSSEACKHCPVRSSVTVASREGRTAKETSRFTVQTDSKRTEYSLNITAAPLQWNGHQYVLLTLEDITELLKLRGLIPRCAWCGRMRDDADYWQSVEAYLRTQHDVQISHGICPDCAEKL